RRRPGLPRARHRCARARVRPTGASGLQPERPGRRPGAAAPHPVRRRSVMNETVSRPPTRPAEFCRGLLAALDASEGRRRRRKRDTTPDAIGLAIKRELLEAAMADDPAPEEFEAWLLGRCLAVGHGSGGVRAMALSIWHEWLLV